MGPDPVRLFGAARFACDAVARTIPALRASRSLDSDRLEITECHTSMKTTYPESLRFIQVGRGIRRFALVSVVGTEQRVITYLDPF